MKKGISLMAVAKGTESKEVEIKRYTGLGAVSVVAVNPTREAYNKLFGISGNNEEINYVSETTVKNSKGEDVKTQQIRISIIVKTDPKIACNNGIDTMLQINYFLTNGYSFSVKDGVIKVQVIDDYGRTAWVTEEELKTGAIPEYEIKRGPNTGQTMKAQISEGYRPCYIGEENITKFIIALLNIPRPDVWDADASTYVMKTDPEELKKSLARLDNIKSYFSGNIKEFRDTVAFQPNNRLKMLFGVRTAQNGNVYQCAYTAMPLKLNVQSLKSLEEALNADKKAGRHPSENYEIGNFKEYIVTATDYSSVSNKEENSDPFASFNNAGSTNDSSDAPQPDVDPFAAF